MSEDYKAAEMLLLRLAEFGAYISAELTEIAEDPEIVQNISIYLLCQLDLHGPMRPAEIVKTHGLTSGGVTKLVDRMEEAKLIERDRSGVPEDHRGVLVKLTPTGRLVIRAMAEQLNDRIPDSSILLAEIERILPNQIEV